jgi:hypothetical protein
MLDWTQDGTTRFIRDIDSMARAAYVWVRQQTFEQRFIGMPVSPIEESALAAGFLAGLKSRLQLGDSESTLVAYIYVLMSGERGGATQSAAELIQRAPDSFVSCAGYRSGLAAAREIVGEGTDQLSTSQWGADFTSSNLRN